MPSPVGPERSALLGSCTKYGVAAIKEPRYPSPIGLGGRHWLLPEPLLHGSFCFSVGLTVDTCLKGGQSVMILLLGSHCRTQSLV